MAHISTQELINSLQKALDNGCTVVKFGDASSEDELMTVDVNDVFQMTHHDNTNPEKSYSFAVIDLINI